MDCREGESWFQEFLDGGSAELPPHLTAHLSACPGCRAFVEAARVMARGLGAVRPVQPPLGLAGRVVAAVAADRRRRLVSRYRWGAAAAAVLVAVPLLAFLLPRGAGPGPAPRTVAVEPAPVAPKSPPPGHAEGPGRPTGRRAAGAEGAGSAVAALTTHLAAKTREQAALLLRAAPPVPLAPMGTLPGVETLQPPLEPTARSLQEAGEEVTKGFQTVTNSARRAVAYFVREIPGLDAAEGMVH